MLMKFFCSSYLDGLAESPIVNYQRKQLATALDRGYLQVHFGGRDPIIKFKYLFLMMASLPAFITTHVHVFS